MDPTFELFLNGIRQFLTDAQSGELSNEDEEYLRILADMKRNLENLQETRECDHTATLLNVCQTVLYGDYNSVKINAAVFSQKINEVKEAETKGMPEKLHPKIKEIKGYFAKLSELIKNMDNLAKEIRNKINDFRKRKFQVTKEEGIEVKFLNIDFETTVKKTDDYYQQADSVLKMFELDVATCKEEYKDKAQEFKGFAILACSLAGVVTFGVGAGVLGTAFAAGLGGSSLVNYFIYSPMCKELDTKCEELKSELRILHAKSKEKETGCKGELKKANSLVNM